ncbi:MAG: hypothetical protein GKR97_20540 [Rhizobiaceae bacterium]|nr:hypothetical protein [Rhizobiaceae bacterium]
MQRRLSAILVADIVGYSKLMGEDQSTTLEALRQFRKARFLPCVTDHRGEVIKSLGDGWIVEFPSISDSVDCAIAVMENLADQNNIQLRIGIHIGEVVIDQDDIFGDGVNVAARLESRAEPGQVLISDVAYNSLDGKSKRLFGGGEHHDLKNIERPVGVWHWPVAAGASASEPTPKLELPEKPSIAILPFDNMSGDPEQEYFADGITEDIITALSKLRSLFVIARNSSFIYKGQAVDIREVSNNLGVRYVLEGSIRKAAGRIRLTGQLIDARSGNHIWAERFDGSLEDVFELQDQITAQVAAAVAPSIRSAEIIKARGKHTSDLTVYDLYLRALEKVNLLESNAAYDLLAQARARSPEFAPAYGLEAWCRTLWIYSTDHLDFSHNADQAVDLARAAMKLSDGDPELLGQIGYALAYFEDNVQLGRDLVTQALESAPCLAWLWSSHGFLEIFWGDRNAALNAFATAQRLDPRDPLAFRAKCGSAICHILNSDYDAALRSAQDAIGMSHGNIAALRFAAVSSALAGNADQAANYVDKILAIEPTYSSQRWYKNMPIRHTSGFQHLVDGMRAAGLPD